MHGAVLDITVEIYFDLTVAHLITPNNGWRRVLLLTRIAELRPDRGLIEPDHHRHRTL
jgi:hypothetical protein